MMRRVGFGVVDVIGIFIDLMCRLVTIFDRGVICLTMIPSLCFIFLILRNSRIFASSELGVMAAKNSFRYVNLKINFRLHV